MNFWRKLTRPWVVAPILLVAGLGAAIANTQNILVGTSSTTGGLIKLFGSTSGDVTIQPAAVAGTATLFQLPASNGSNTNVLTTDGTGVLSWSAAGTGNCTVSGSAGIVSNNGSSACTTDTAATLSTGALSLGSSGTAGSVVVGGSSSGTQTWKTAATAGTTTITWPGGTTDFSGTGGSNQVVKQTSSGGAFTVGTLACANLSDGATGCSTATGTSGATLPLLNGTNTWSGTQTFGTTVGTINTQSGTTYTLAASDCGKTILFTSASAVTLTTLNSLSAGCAIAVEQGAAGQITVANGSGATLTSAHSYTKTFNAVGAIIGLFVDTNSGGSAAHFVLTGDGA
jgi:hypothetical protein